MDIISVADYPRATYRAYWEIGIDQRTSRWTARIYGLPAGELLVEQTAGAPNMKAARLASQTWVKGQMDGRKPL